MAALAEVTALKEALDRHRPLSKEKMAIMAEKLNIEWTYHSNAIEGNTLTLAETSFFLREGLTVEGKPLDDHLAAKNHYEAIHYLEECLNLGISEALIKQIHGLLLKGIEYVVIGKGPTEFKKRVYPGQYKYDNNHVLLPDGSIHWYVDHLQVPGEMESLIKWYGDHRATLHPVELAAGFHHRLVAIHPFTDGNGRVARVIMNLILMQNQYPPAVIRNEQRREYFDALRKADGGDIAPFTDLVAQAVARTARLMVDVAEGRLDLTTEDIKAKIERLSQSAGAPEETEAYQKVKEVGAEISGYLSKLVKEMVVPFEPSKRFGTELESWASTVASRSQFQDFCRLKGFKPLGPNFSPQSHPALRVIFRDAINSNWAISFQVVVGAKEIMVFRTSTEDSHQLLDLKLLPFIRTPVMAPDRKEIKEFVLREAAAFVDRASAALDRHEQQPN